MKKCVRVLLTALCCAVLFLCGSLTGSAKEVRVSATESAVNYLNHSPSVKVGNALLDAAFQPQKTLSDLFGDKTVTGVFLLSEDAVDAAAEAIAKNAKIYIVELRDGRKTYYMAVDFREDNAVYLSNLFVTRSVSEKLLKRSESMAAKQKSSVDLMDYTHIFGELTAHYVGYRITDAMGGEALPGKLRSVYNSCTVADLNIDENRMAIIIRIIGLLLG